KHPGGAEVEISVLFADVRGSTGLAENASPAQFRNRLQAFYKAAWDAINNRDGILDKFLGDGVMALFIPGIAGALHAARAGAAGGAAVTSSVAPQMLELKGRHQPLEVISL